MVADEAHPPPLTSPSTVDLDRLLNPRSIAFVGGRQAELAIAQCDALGYDGEIWPVHPTRDTVAGRTASRSVADLPDPPGRIRVLSQEQGEQKVCADLRPIPAPTY